MIETGMFVADTTGTTTTISCGFLYKAIILYSFGNSTSEAERANALFSIGLSDGTNVRCTTMAGNDAVATTAEGKTARTVKVLEFPSASVGGVPTIANSVVSVAFNSSTFVLTFTAQPSSAYKVGYIGFGGSDITNAFVGSDVWPLTPTNPQTFSGIGFQGDFVFFASSRIAATGTAADMDIDIGCAVDASHQWAAGMCVKNNVTTSAAIHARSYSDNAKCLLNVNATVPTLTAEAAFTGWTSDGFTTNVTNAPTNANLINYLVLKGGRWDCGVSAKPTTATTQTVTGSSIAPSFVGLLLTGATANATLTSEAQLTFGGMTATSQDFAGCYHNDVINTVAKSNGSSAACIAERTGSSTWNQAAYTSLNADGWTVTWNNTGSAFLVGWFAYASTGIDVITTQMQWQLG